MLKRNPNLLVALLVVSLILCVGPSVVAKTNLRILVHGDFNQPTLDHYLDEYTKLNPDIAFEKQVVPFDDLLTTIQISALSGQTPDIMHIYLLWGVELSHTIPLPLL